MRAERSAYDREVAERKVGHAMFVATLGLCLLYDWYRYPFRISSALTPGYSNTPVVLQAGKYAILGAICVVLLVRTRRAFALPDSLLATACAWIGARALVGVLASHETPAFDVAASFVFGGFIAILFPVLRVGRLAYLAAAAAVVVHAIANVVEMLLWWFTGRLPGLSFPGEAIKRFGGLWDDPNSVGLFCALVIVYLVACRRYRWWLIAVAAFSIVVSVSYSALAALVVGLWVVVLSRRRRIAFALVPLIVATAVAVFLLPVGHVPAVGSWLASKQDSALQRVGRDTLPAPDSWLLGGSVPRHSESSVAALINTAGLIGLCLVILWLVVSIRRTSVAKREWAFPVLVAFLFASQVVPYIGVFPLATLFPIFLLQLTRPSAASVQVDQQPMRHVEADWATAGHAGQPLSMSADVSC